MKIKAKQGIHGISGFLDSIHRPVFEKTRRFGNSICFRPQVKWGKKTPTQLGPLERNNPPFYLRTETDGVSETSCSFKHRMMDKAQKPRNSLCHSPSSQLFRRYTYLQECYLHSGFKVLCSANGMVISKRKEKKRQLFLHVYH
jgi:hypothetical protein